MPKGYDPVKAKMSNGPAVPDAPAAAAAPTKAEYDALAGKVNVILAALRDAGILAEN